MVFITMEYDWYMVYNKKKIKKDNKNGEEKTLSKAVWVIDGLVKLALEMKSKDHIKWFFANKNTKCQHTS